MMKELDIYDELEAGSVSSRVVWFRPSWEDTAAIGFYHPENGDVEIASVTLDETLDLQISGNSGGLAEPYRYYGHNVVFTDNGAELPDYKLAGILWVHFCEQIRQDVAKLVDAGASVGY